MTRNSVCKMNVEKTARLHTMVEKVDGQGRKFKTCDWCGFTEVASIETTLKYQKDAKNSQK